MDSEKANDQTLQDMENSVCTGNYRNEKDRLKTFDMWPIKRISPMDLVKSGFFYTRMGDEIKCAFCGMQFSNWYPDHDPNEQHQMYSYECDFLQNRECGNIPLRT